MGRGPKLIMSSEEFRIEELVEGRALTLIELSHPEVIKIVSHLLCDFHYNPILRKRIEDHLATIPGAKLQFVEGMILGKGGWIERAIERHKQLEGKIEYAPNRE